MRKLKLEIDDLRVESFRTVPSTAPFGTVHGHSDEAGGEAEDTETATETGDGFLSLVTCGCGATRCGASCVRTCDSCVGSPSCATVCLGTCPVTGPNGPCRGIA